MSREAFEGKCSTSRASEAILALHPITTASIKSQAPGPLHSRIFEFNITQESNMMLMRDTGGINFSRATTEREIRQGFRCKLQTRCSSPEMSE